MLTPPFIQHLPPSYNLELESKHYQDIKKRLQTKARERYQSYSKEKKTKKKKNMVMKDTKISQNMKNKSWLSIEKNVMKWKNISDCWLT